MRGEGGAYGLAGYGKGQDRSLTCSLWHGLRPPHANPPGPAIFPPDKAGVYRAISAIDMAGLLLAFSLPWTRPVRIETQENRADDDDDN